MYRQLKALNEYHLEAVDGTLGRVKDFYFDDWVWTLRYLVADTGPWLLGREVLISPEAFERVDWDGRRLHLNITKERVRSSPPIDADKPVSRQKEQQLVTFYRWPMYWINADSDPSEAQKGDYPEASAMRDAYERRRTEGKVRGDPHLQSVKAVRGFTVHAKDGTAGKLLDFILDDEVWALRYAVVDTRPFGLNGDVLIETEWLRETDWDQKECRTTLTREQVAQSPRFEPFAAASRDEAGRLVDFSGRPVVRR